MGLATRQFGICAATESVPCLRPLSPSPPPPPQHSNAPNDPRFSARETLGGRGAPSAALLGADGMLAGGPVVGGDEVIGFAAEIAQQIREARAQGALPAAERAAH